MLGDLFRLTSDPPFAIQATVEEFDLTGQFRDQIGWFRVAFGIPDQQFPRPPQTSLRVCDSSVGVARTGRWSRVPPREGFAMGDCPTRTTSSGVVVVLPSGRLNMTAAPELREQLHSLVKSGHTRLVVDLTGVDAIDSSGLGALISGLKVARQTGGDLRIAAPSEQVTAVFELTNLNRVLKSYASADRAFDEPA